MEFNRDTRLADVLKAYPWLPDELTRIDVRFGILKTAVGRMMIKNATIADAVDKTGLKEDELIAQLQGLIEKHGA